MSALEDDVPDSETAVGAVFNWPRGASIVLPWTLGIVGADSNRDYEMMTSTLYCTGGSTVQFGSLTELQTALGSSGQLDGVVFYLDELGGLGAAYRILRQIRLKYPNVMIIAASRRFGHDDFGTDRMSISDINLKLPAFASTFIAALLQAAINNQNWRDRDLTGP